MLLLVFVAAVVFNEALPVDPNAGLLTLGQGRRTRR